MFLKIELESYSNSDRQRKIMSIARCQECGKPKGRTHNYVKKAEPLGYPNTAIVCGSKGCENSAYVWLSEEEAKEFENGQRVFPFPTFAVKVKVSDK